jgi:oxygen-independent coproporphyrinogen-3 oxidase
MYCELMEEVPVIRELHLGGGTPTFFSMKNLERLLRHFLDNGMVYSTPKFSFEGHPNNTTDEHLRGLYNLGFRRVSFGVQDNDAVVQRAINRIQPLENVERVTRQARDAGYESVNYDLIYGLPFQTISSTQKTVQECIALKPDRFAFYSYAHVPWASRGQRLFDENDLPAAVEKMKFYQEAVRIFEANQYHQIGMDHFVLASDDLYKASLSDSLHRNFMGYTEQPTHLQLGLGVSAISDTGNAFAQNQKSLTDYYRMIQSGVLPTQKGYFLNGQDKNFKKYILDISCKGRTYFRREDLPVLEQISFPQLRKLELDGLVNFNDRFVEVTQLGKSFIRNICRAFDMHLFKKETSTGEKVYSRAI